MKYLLLLPFTVLANLCQVYSLPPAEGVPSPKKIVLGSCQLQHFKSQNLWKTVLQENPNLIILLGDNVYIDSYDSEKHKAAYHKLKKEHGFEKILATIPTLAVWDDHDYGRNDDGDNHPQKNLAKSLFLEAFEIPKSREVWKREGIYDSYLFQENNQTLQIILLDTRTFRSPLQTDPEGKRTCPEGYNYGKYQPHQTETHTLLGKAQWDWLKKELQKKADLRILISSIQVLSNQHGWECWGNFPNEREQLLSLLKTSSGNTIIFSGDRHFSEISKLQTDKSPFEIYDITVSPLLYKSSYSVKEKNPYRLEGPITQNNYATLEISPTQLTLTFKSPKGTILKQKVLPLPQDPQKKNNTESAPLKPSA